MRIYVPSTATALDYCDPGATPMWCITIHKPDRAPAVCTAVEGGKSATSFTTMHPGSRMLRAPLAGRATDKAKRQAVAAMLAALRLQGCITAEAHAAAAY